MNLQRSQLLEGVKTSWEKLLFMYTFVRDVSATLRREPALTLDTLTGVQGNSLRTQRTFRVLIRMLSDLNRKFSRQGSEIECDICCCIPVNPVRSCLQCRRIVCRKCITTFMASNAFKQNKACFHCRRPNSGSAADMMPLALLCACWPALTLTGG